MTSPFALLGPNLIELGYTVIPIMPGTKSPGEVINGRWARMTGWSSRYGSRPPSQYQIGAWCKLDDAGIGMLTGRVSNKIIGVDIDVDDVVDAVTRGLPETPAMKEGYKGRTLLFRSNLPNSNFNRNEAGRRERMVDILSDGRQTVLPPTIHPDLNRPYRWLGDPLDKISVDDIPWLPDDAFELLEEILTPYGYDKNKDPHTHAIISGKGPKIHVPEDYESRDEWQQVNALAWANAEKWIPALHLYKMQQTPWGYEAVADWRLSSDGTPTPDRKTNLKINFEKQRIVDFGDGQKGYDPINLVAAMRGRGKSEAWTWLSERVGWCANVVGTDNLQITVREDDAKPVVVEKPETPPLWQAPGLIGRMTQYMIDTAMYQQPMFALAASISIIGAACARQILGPTGSSTHTFCLCVGPSASGKEHPMRCMQEILDGADLDRLQGPSSFTSYSAVIQKLIDKPACIAIMDEMGAFLAKGKGRNVASFERSIFAVIRSIWANCGGSMPTEMRAQAKDVKLYWPALSLFGTSTVDELFESLTTTDMSNGLMNRFLVFQNRKYPRPSKPKYKREEVPADIIEGVKAIAGRCKDAAHRQHGFGDQPVQIDAFTVPWDNVEVEDYYESSREAIRARMENNALLQTFLGRASEYAVRIATILAIGRNVEEPRVTMEDFKWAEALVLECFESLAQEASDHMSQGFKDQDNKKVRRAARNLEAKNDGWFAVRDIQRQSVARPLKSDEIIKCLAYYEELGEVLIEHRQTDSGRKAFYKFIK